MRDKIFEAFLVQQFAEGLDLARSSDVLKLIPMPGGDPPSRYIAHFKGRKGLVRDDRGDIVEFDHFAVGIWFPDDYLRAADPFVVVTWLQPSEIFHPNICSGAPVICLGHLAPGTPLVDILYRCFEIITYARVTMQEHDALNKEACAWARRNQHRFPVDRRPLKRHAPDVEAMDFDVLEVTP